MKVKVFVIVVDYHGGQKLARCLQALKKIAARIVVIDNNQTNRGFAKAVNLGIKQALQQQATHILLVNQDVVIQKNFLPPLLKNKADIVAPIIKFKRNNRWVQDWGGQINFLSGTTKHRSSSGPIDYLSGCVVLIKAAVFQKIGLFDERFFLYFEDVDFCLRAQKAGLQIAVEPKSTAVHFLEEGRQRSFFKKRHHLKSRLLFINKYWKMNLC